MVPISRHLSARGRQISAVFQRRCYLLFLSLLAYLILYPYIQREGQQYIFFRGFGVLVTFLSVYAVSFRRPILIAGLMLAVPAFLQRLLLPRGDEGTLALVSVLFTFGFDIFIVVVIFRRVFARHVPNAETIFGALCIYLLVGFTFGNIYHLLASVQTRAFYLDPSAYLRQIPNRFDLVYYSFGMITCLGAAGITPVSDQARSLSLIEAILGIFYLAILISKLMSTYQAYGNDDDSVLS